MNSSSQLVTITLPTIGIPEAGKYENDFSVYPNPFSDRLSIHYELSGQSEVSLDIIDVLGRKVGTLVDNQKQAAGEYSYSVQKDNLPASTSLMLVRLVVNGKPIVRKVMVRQ
jgi:hypothetical protein